MFSRVPRRPTTSSMGTPQPARDPCPDHETDRTARGLAERAYRLVADITDGHVVDPCIPREIIEEGYRHNWPEVVTAGMYLDVATSRRLSREKHLASIERLLTRAEAQGDALHAALALGRRASVLTSPEDPAASLSAGRDLARASVLLETAPGPPELRARAHVVCSAAYSQRNLWEIVDESYRTAEAVLGCEATHPGLW